jgi:HK97 family phage major capsid protein
MVGPTSDPARPARPSGDTDMTAKVRADALRAAADAFETICRLNQYEQRTTAQDRDREMAIASWDAQRSALPELPAWDAMAESSNTARKAIKALEDMIKGERAYEDPTYAAVRAAATGTDARPNVTDEIRAMIAGGESVQDFDYPWTGTDESRAIANFSDADSLHMADFGSKVAVYQRTLSPWLGLANVVRSSQGRDLVVPSLTADPTTYTPGEGTAITPSDPTMAPVTIVTVAYKALSYVSAEAWEDEQVNLSSLVANSAARSISLAFGQAATTAILAGATNAGTATGAGGVGTAVAPFFGLEDLIDLKYSAAAPYRANGSWVLSNGAIRKISKWKDQDGGYFNLSGDLFDGKPPYEDPYLASPGSATRSVLYGDMFAGLIIKASPLRVAVSTDYRFNTDEVAIKTVQRLGIGVVDATAVRYIVSATT